MKSLLKKPTNGGIPAIENNNKEKVNIKTIFL
jgi:hypothetical protein